MPSRGHAIFVRRVSLTSAWVLAAIAVPSSRAADNPEFCEVLNKWNAEKKIPDAEVRGRFEGEYGQAADTRHIRTWNITTACEDFLVAVPLWADVSPPVLSGLDGDVFEDTMGSTWEFQTGSDGSVIGVKMAAADGAVSEMERLGPPRTSD